ncbi:MAG: hypothetical protein JO089_02845, partial [Alphaproteobacteria bacterium]|nr:hypothetical protein [Alphaproteobacteria bacterium]
MKHTYIALLAGAAVCLPATAQAAEILACSKYMENPPSSPPYGRPMDQRDMRDMRGQYEHPPQNRPWEADPAATGHSTYRPWPRL